MNGNWPPWRWRLHWWLRDVGVVVRVWALPVVFTAEVAVVGAYFGWHLPVSRWLVVVGLAVLAVLVVVDTVLERRAS